MPQTMFHTRDRRTDFGAGPHWRKERDPASEFWELWWGVCSDGYALHPDTEPESIARDQREEVARAVDFLSGLGAVTAEAVGELVCLPTDVVRRRLAELGVTT